MGRGVGDPPNAKTIKKKKLNKKKFWRMLKTLASHENLSGYTKYRRLVKI
jgi:hypothetical protein